MKKFLWVILLGMVGFLLFWGIFSFQDSLLKKESITIYTYESFTGEWGPGQELAKLFQEKLGTEIVWEGLADGAGLLARLKHEGPKTRADVVLGFDQFQLPFVMENQLFDPHKISEEKVLALPRDSFLEMVVPVDYGPLALMYDSEVMTPFASMEEFLNSPESLKILIQDPSLSTPGLNFIAWLHKLAPEKFEENLKRLKEKTYSVSPGWSQSYKLFTKKEAPMVLSYISSEIYHRMYEENKPYKAMIFDEGHYVQVELAGVSQYSSQKEKAHQFLDFLLTPEAQKIIAEKNSMYPVLFADEVKGLHPAFSQLEVFKPLYHTSEELKDLPKWVEMWQNIFSQK